MSPVLSPIPVASWGRVPARTRAPLVQAQVSSESMGIAAPERIDPTQGLVPRGTPLPADIPDSRLTAPDRQALQQRRRAAQRQRLVKALTAIITDTPEAGQACQVLWDDIMRRTSFNTHYQSGQDGPWHTVPAIEHTQDREDLTSLIMEKLWCRLPTLRMLSLDKCLRQYYRLICWHHISWYRRLCRDRDRTAGMPYPDAEPAAVPEDDMQAVGQTLIASEEGARPRSLRLDAPEAAAVVLAVLPPLMSVSSATAPDQIRTSGAQPAALHELCVFVHEVVTLLQALSVDEDSRERRLGSIALLRYCQGHTIRAVAYDLRVNESTLRGCVLVVRHYLKTRLGLG
jgi:hypothetical protein